MEQYETRILDIDKNLYILGRLLERNDAISPIGLISNNVKELNHNIDSKNVVEDVNVLLKMKNNKPNNSDHVIQQDSPSMRKALECLRYTDPEISDFSYPRDASQHFQDIHNRLNEWIQKPGHKPHRAKGYRGPWIENQWISHFQQELESKNKSLSDVFGPYIPLFIPWTDIWVKRQGKRRKNRIKTGFRYPKQLVSDIKDLLRDDVLYITVNQNADGFVGRCTEFLDLQSKHHVTVLSAGGYGHVPIPLLKQPETPQTKKPVNERKHLVSYVGSNKNAPKNMRKKMIAQDNHYYYRGQNWRDVMTESKFSLCPRGFGRTSYHVMEALQMGLIPIQVYQDQPWLPYGDIMQNISYSVTNEDLPGLIEQLSKMPDSEIAEIEDRIENMREDYFSFEGTLKQISNFMLNPVESQLVCQKLPSDSGTAKKELKSCS